MGNLTPRTPTTTFSSTARTTMPLSVPTGTVEDDLMIAFFAIGANSDPGTQTSWNTQETLGATALSWGIYWRWATSSEPSSYDFSHASARDAGIMISIPGVDPTTPIITETTEDHGAGNRTFNSIDPGAVESVVLGFLAMLEAAPDEPTVATTNCDSIVGQKGSTAASGTNAGVAILQEYLASGGAFVPTYTIASGTLTRSGTIAIALTPAEEAPPPTGTINLMENSDFSDTGLNAEWTPKQNGSMSTPATSGISGARCIRLESTSTGANPYLEPTGLFIPVASEQIGQYVTAYAQYKWDSVNTPNSTTRLNITFRDASNAAINTKVGSPFAPSASAWTRTQQNNNQIPASTAWIEIRPIINNSVVGDAILVDRIMVVIEPGDHSSSGPFPRWQPAEGEAWPPEVPYFRSLTSDEALGGDTTLVLAPPEGVTANDIQVVAITFSSGDDPISSPASGWNLLLAYDNPHSAGGQGENERIEVYWNKGSTGSATFSKSSTITKMHGVRLAYSAPSGYQIVNLSYQPQNDTLTRSSTHSIPAQTSTRDDTMIVSITSGEERGGFITDWVAPANFVERYNHTGDEAEDLIHLNAGDFFAETPQTVSGESWTSTEASWSTNVSFRIEYVPPATDGATKFFQFI